MSTVLCRISYFNLKHAVFFIAINYCLVVLRFLLETLFLKTRLQWSGMYSTGKCVLLKLLFFFHFCEKVLIFKNGFKCSLIFFFDNFKNSHFQKKKNLKKVIFFHTNFNSKNPKARKNTRVRARARTGFKTSGFTKP